MIDIEHNSQQNFQKVLRTAIAQTMIDEIIETESYDNEMVKSFLSTFLSEECEIDLIKAIGLIHYKDDENAMRIVNDFCGLLLDIMNEGKEALKK